MKAADQAISRGSFRFGYNLLSRAHSISRTIEEYEIVEKVVAQGLQDILRFKSKSPKPNSNPSTSALRGSFTRQYASGVAAEMELQLIEDFNKLKDAVHNSIEPPITVSVQGSETGRKQTLQLKPMIYNAPLFSVKEVSERDFFGTLKMLSFRSNRSLKDGTESGTVANKLPDESGTHDSAQQTPILKLQLSYTENLSRGLFRKSGKTSVRGRNLEENIGNIEEGVELEDESASSGFRTPRKQHILRKLQSRINTYFVRPVANSYPFVVFTSFLQRSSRFFCGMLGIASMNQAECESDSKAASPRSIPLRRRVSMSGS